MIPPHSFPDHCINKMRSVLLLPILIWMAAFRPTETKALAKRDEEDGSR